MAVRALQQRRPKGYCKTKLCVARPRFDPRHSFYQGSTITITRNAWSVTPPSYTKGDRLELQMNATQIVLVEHDKSGRDYFHSLTLAGWVELSLGDLILRFFS